MKEKKALVVTDTEIKQMEMNFTSCEDCNYKKDYEESDCNDCEYKEFYNNTEDNHIIEVDNIEDESKDTVTKTTYGKI